MPQSHLLATPRSQLRPSIARDTSGDAPPQLLNVSLSFEHVTGCRKAHRDRPGAQHFPSLCEAVQVNAMPRWYLIRLREAVACSAGG